MGGNFNATTQQTVTQYYFTVPASDLETALNIEAIRMRDVLNTEDLWNQEGELSSRKSRRTSPTRGTCFIPGSSRDLCRNALCPRRPWYASVFQKTTGNMLKDFHRKWYAPNNAILVIAGIWIPQWLWQR